MSGLSPAELERYSRQLVLPEWSGAAQRALRDGSVLVVGVGALGSPVAQYLAAAGVGRLSLVDDDEVALSDLARQVIHYTPDLHVNKAHSAAAKLRFLNPEIEVEVLPVRFDAANAAAMVLGHDVVVDCTDRFETRALVTAAAVEAGVPIVEGGILGLAGVVMSTRPRETACYRCVFPVEPDPDGLPTCAEAGVLGPLAGIAGSLQALEAIKLLTGVGEPLLDRMLQIDAATGAFTEIRTSRLPDCAVCGVP